MTMDPRLRSGLILPNVNRHEDPFLIADLTDRAFCERVLKVDIFDRKLRVPSNLPSAFPTPLKELRPNH